MKTRINKEQVNQLLEILSQKLCEPKNSQIRESIRKILDNADLRDLRDIMHLSGYRSVDYSYIKEDILRTQLEVDNLRMEDAAHSTQLSDEERFFVFSINAFYQIENLTNYYFVKLFPKFEDLLSFIENNSNYKHKTNQLTGEIKEKNVGDIEISCKIYALANKLFPSTKKQPDFTYKTICGLRLVRNEGFHRCQIEGIKTNEKLQDFYKYNDCSTIRALITKYSDAIKEDLGTPARIQEQLDEYIKIPHTDQKIDQELLDNIQSAKLIHYHTKNDESCWKIEISDGENKVNLYVHEKYFVNRYCLYNNQDMLPILPKLNLYDAIHKKHWDMWVQANNNQKLNPKEDNIRKEYHIIKIISIVD
jgi:hypothetical protein